MPPEQGGQTPVIALTAFARSEDRRRAMLSGFDIHVSKPVEPGELIAVARNGALADLIGMFGNTRMAQGIYFQENEMESQLTGSHRHAYDALFRHPVAHNLQWRDVWSVCWVPSPLRWRSKTEISR